MAGKKRAESEVALEESNADDVADAGADGASEHVQPEFGDDALGRVQGILFGDHARDTKQRIDMLERSLLGVIDDVKSELSDRLDALQRQLEAEAETRTKGHANLSSRIDAEEKGRAQRDGEITESLHAAATELGAAIESVETAAKQALDETRTDLSSSLDAAGSDLRKHKVDRSSLADLLRETAAQLDVGD